MIYWGQCLKEVRFVPPRVGLMLGAALLSLVTGCAGLKPQSPAAPGSPAAETPVTTQPAGSSDTVEPLAGHKAPSIVARDVFTKEPVTLSSLKGQPVMLNFWATWCGPCRLEMPAMEEFQKETGGKVRIIALGGDSFEGPEKLAEFSKQLGLTFTIAYDGGEAAEKYRIIGLPTTFVIDKDGIIRYKHQGQARIEDMRKWAAELEKPGT